MITRETRTNSAYAAAYETALTASITADRMQHAAVGNEEREERRDTALAAAAGMIPAEVKRLATAAESGTELLAELIALIYRRAEPLPAARWRLSGAEPFSGLTANMGHLDYVEVSTGVLLDDLASDWETLTDEVKAKDATATVADARAALKSPARWLDVHALACVAYGVDVA